jgi:hypothetical protein
MGTTRIEVWLGMTYSTTNPHNNAGGIFVQDEEVMDDYSSSRSFVQKHLVRHKPCILHLTDSSSLAGNAIMGGAGEAIYASSESSLCSSSSHLHGVGQRMLRQEPSVWNIAARAPSSEQQSPAAAASNVATLPSRLSTTLSHLNASSDGSMAEVRLLLLDGLANPVPLSVTNQLSVLATAEAVDNSPAWTSGLNK